MFVSKLNSSGIYFDYAAITGGVNGDEWYDIAVYSNTIRAADVNADSDFVLIL